jgi:hypothetical protein
MFCNTFFITARSSCCGIQPIASWEKMIPKSIQILVVIVAISIDGSLGQLKFQYIIIYSYIPGFLTMLHI